jgi:hypothetical protein
MYSKVEFSKKYQYSKNEFCTQYQYNKIKCGKKCQYSKKGKYKSEISVQKDRVQ